MNVPTRRIALGLAMVTVMPLLAAESPQLPTTAAATTLYLHVFDWPNDGKLLLPGLKNQVLSATLVAGGKKLAASMSPEGLVVNAPHVTPDRISSTVVVNIAGSPQIE